MMWKRPIMVAALGLFVALLAPWSSVSAQSDNAEAQVSGRIEVEGLACPFCVNALEKKLRAIEWIQSVTIYIDDGRAEFDVRPGHTPDVGELRRQVRDGGFTPGDTNLSATGRVQRSNSDVWLVVGEDVRLALKAGRKRDAMLEELGDSEQQVAVSGEARTRGDRTLISIEQYHVGSDGE